MMSVDQCSPDQVNTYSKIAFGCPSWVTRLGRKEFEPFFEQVEASLQGKKLLCLVPMTGNRRGMRTGVTA
ncbi:MAG: hypothetical protein ACLSCV_08075 [Acutalibacteraceae bacterium]